MTAPAPKRHDPTAAAARLHALITSGQKENVIDTLATTGPALRDMLAVKNDNGDTALHSLLLQGWHDLIAPAVTHGADINAENKSGETVLHLALKNKGTEALESVLSAGAHPDAKVAGYADTALIRAIKAEDIDQINMLLYYGANPAITDSIPAEDGQNAYHHAAQTTAEVMAIMLAQPDAAKSIRVFCPFAKTGTNVFAKTEADVFRIALHTGNKDIVQQLIEYGVDINGRDPQKNTPMQWLLQHHYARADALPLLKLLLKHGADIEKTRNDWGDTPLMSAAQADFASAVGLLLDAGANPQLKNYFDETPLHMAARHYTTASITALIESGAEVDAQDHHGQTALHIAAHRNRRDVVKTLLAHDADTDIRDKKGRTADEICQAPVQQTTRNLLLSRRQQRSLRTRGRGYAKRAFNRKDKVKRYERYKKPSSKGFGNRP